MARKLRPLPMLERSVDVIRDEMIMHARRNLVCAAKKIELERLVGEEKIPELLKTLR